MSTTIHLFPSLTIITLFFVALGLANEDPKTLVNFDVIG